MADILERELYEKFAELRELHGTKPLERVEEFLQVATRKKRIPRRDPLQRPELYFFPGLTSRAWHDAPPPWMPRLEEATSVIRRELDGLLGAPEGFVPYVHGPESAYRAEKFQLRALSERWTIYDLHEPAAERQCPETTRVLETLFRFDLGEPVTAQFSALRPGSHIPPHCGVANFFLTAHLGLVTPEACRLRVGEESRTWQDGRGMVFDDSFEHEVWNDGEATRIVLIARFWHPELTAIEIEALGALHGRVIELAGGTVPQQRDALMRLRGEA